jgi:hypothetical protein
VINRATVLLDDSHLARCRKPAAIIASTMPTAVTGHIVDVTVVMYLTVAAVTGPTAASNSMT